ncbi:MAG TPA: ADYC domain-containing protein [Kofleriaceae bacterium]|nr:ADYC domain-containing protein [Kofleriaceae bacterium]
MIGCVLAGCAVDGVEPEVQVSEVHQGLYDEEYNGPSIVGPAFETPLFIPDGATEYFSVGTIGTRDENAGTVIGTVELTGGASLKSGRFKDLTGVVLSSGTVPAASDVHLRIVGVRPDGDATHYVLDAADGTGPYSRVCNNAIPLYGVVDRAGAHLARSNRLTFSCEEGAVSKCTRFGYPAGLPGSRFWGVHQACLQMLPANYCAVADSNTRPGTSIAFYDTAGVYPVPAGLQIPIMDIASWPPNASDYYFEAAFKPVHTPAACNTRSRWPLITSSCVAALPDCPIATDTLTSNPWNATLLVGSKFNQLLLHRWRSNDGTGRDRVSTVRGYHNPNDVQERPPWPGYAYGGTDGVLLRIPPTSVPPGGIVAVSMFRGASNDMFVARSDDARFNGGPYTDVGQEGYVYLSPADVPNPRALRLYRNPTTGDVSSSTLTADEVADSGYLPAPDATGSNLVGFIAGVQ